ncbi:MAG TPA: DNA recombination protein RmuC [Candidatus Paceibacterota bacterium]|nr:DNA recombination protein RmuC [Candidatus Paceibacterota bacterium]HRY76993.1 DNA recombination protein RmuC [Candidatus Paceibacterota bacterium]
MSVTWLFILTIFLLIGGIVLILVALSLLARRLAKSRENDQSLVLLQNQMGEINRTMDTKLAESTRLMQNQFGQSAKIIQDVTEKLVKLDETNKQVVNFADQLQNLQDILKNPKQRGILGEYYLETALKNVLPPGSYQMQYKLDKDEDGKDLIVDAVIFVKERIIPVDSKFSLENYNRLLEERDPDKKEELEKAIRQDLKNRIDETSKYIRPKKGTMEFALMFIPSEALYYDLLINKVGSIKSDTNSLVQYAAGEKKVIIVSAMTFHAYLQTVLQGLRAMQIEDSTKGIIKNVGELIRHFASYETYLKKMGNNLGTTVNMYNTAYKEFGKIDKDILKITGKSASIEPLVIESPKQDEE